MDTNDDAEQIGALIDRATELRDAITTQRRPSKAAAVVRDPRVAHDPEIAFFQSLALARSVDSDLQAEGKARLAEMGSVFADPDPAVKATLGTTDAGGGYILPNAAVDDLTKAAAYANPYRQLVTVRTGVRSTSIDIPFRSSRPARATIAGVGTLKENVDLTYNNYTATLYTLARIYDVSNRLLRYSGGVAERDVRQELGTAIGLGEAYYMISGSGTSEPYGLRTALTNAPATFTSSFSPSATTLAGSVLSAISTAAGALAARGRRPEAAVLSATMYWTMAAQGTDTAGFFLAGTNGNVLPGIASGTLVTPFGIPVYPDDAAIGSDDLIVGEWSALKLYVGQDIRVDVSDVAGTRWDYNLTGFRGEEDIAFDARPAVYSGAFQLVEDITP